jgi:cellulose biosynthesis protein BcsQ
MMMHQREYDDNKSKYSVIDKAEMLKMIEDLREGMMQERQAHQRIINMYERQLQLQDNEIQRLQAQIAELEANPRTKYASSFE